MNTDSYPRLFKLIRECAQTTDRLPPEDVLAQQLGISHVKLRDMLATLQANGYISRKRASAPSSTSICWLKRPAWIWILFMRR